MEKSNIVVMVLFALLASGFILVSCNNNTTSGIGGGGRIDPALVGKWYPDYWLDSLDLYQDIYGDRTFYEFTSDEKYVHGDAVLGTYHTSGGKITTYTPYTRQIMGSADYIVSDTKLTISYAEVTSYLYNGDYYRRETDLSLRAPTNVTEGAKSLAVAN